MRQIVEMLLIAQAAFACLLLCAAYAGAYSCRRHERRATADVIGRRLKARGSAASPRAPTSR